MILKAVRIFFSIILSIVLFLSSIAFIAVLTVHNSLKPDSIKSILKSEAVSAAIGDSLYTSLGEQDMPELFKDDMNRLVGTVIDGEGFDAVLNEYVEALTNYILTSEQKEVAVSDEAKQKLVQDAKAAFEAALGEFGISGAQAEEAMQKFETDINKAVNGLPRPNEVLQTVEIYNDYSWAAGYMLSPAVLFTAGAVMLLVSCAIALLIFHRYRWMKYVAIPLLISGVIAVAAGVFTKVSASMLFGEIEQSLVPLINSFIGSISRYFFIAGGAYLLIVVVLFALTFLIKRSPSRRAPA